ncbi:efflux RND transporter permease subunit [Veronia nyctiphanis]|uniref:efflux RND transporter permease subunit n=1 Tax=Veronia nyctiphanis TaxID=1278244 RepID=UPI001F2ECFDA|nr:MMPL family transporter [Veronia nyctiphanis]
MRGKLFRIPIAKAWLCIALTLFCVLLSAAGNKNLYFNGDYKTFFDNSNPQLQAHQSIENAFLKSDSLGIVIEPENGNVFTKENLTLIREITDAFWQANYVRRVDSITNYQHTSAEGDDLLVEDLAPDYLPLDDARIAHIKEIALSAPRLKGSLVSEAGDISVVNVSFNGPDGDPTKLVAEIAVFTRDIFAEMEQRYPGVKFHMVGIVALNMSLTEAAIADATTLIPMMFTAVVIFLGIMLKSWRFVCATLAIIVTSIIATMGLVGWMEHYLTTALVNVPTVVMTLAVADCVHIIASYINIRRAGTPHRDAILESINLNMTALVITSVTTSIGFLMLNASESPALRDFGTLTAIGILVAFFLSVTLLPALLTVMPEKDSAFDRHNDKQSMDRLALWIIRFHKAILPAGIVVIAVSSVLMMQNKVDDKQYEYFDTGSPFRQAVELVNDSLKGSTVINISLDTGVENGITSPEFLRTLEEFTLWLNTQPEVGHVISLSDTIKRLNKNMHGDDSDYYRIPLDSSESAQYLLLFELSLPYGLDLTNEINLDKSAVKLTITIRNLGSAEMVAFEQRVKQWLSDNTPNTERAISSISLMFAHIGEVNMASMLKTLPITLLVISGLLIFALRSLRLGVVSLIPNIAPAILGFGLWALLSGEINLGLSVVITMTMGIVVDDTVHFLSKYRHSRFRERVSKRESSMHFRPLVKHCGSLLSFWLLALAFLLRQIFA